MKRVWLFAILFVIIFSATVSAAANCVLNVSMINQDPYPATPGESVKVVFKIDGISAPGCQDTTFEVEENFPFTVDPESVNPVKVTAGTYSTDYNSFYIAAYKLRVDKAALKGDTPIEIRYYSGTSAKTTEKFNIYVEDTKTDFEIFIKDYDALTKTLTFEILNIGEVDIEALTLEIPKQENIDVKKTNKVVVGDLDSNEYTTADFEATPKDGEITIKIIYTDSTNTRREIEKTVNFDSSYFEGLSRNQTAPPIWIYLIVLGIIGFIIWKVYRRHKKKKLHH